METLDIRFLFHKEESALVGCGFVFNVVETADIHLEDWLQHIRKIFVDTLFLEVEVFGIPIQMELHHLLREILSEFHYRPELVK